MRVAVLAAGYLLLALGLVLVVLPGPGAVVLLAGLAVVGRSQRWARRVEVRLRAGAAALARRLGAALSR